MDQPFVPDLSVVTPAYDANGRLHESVYTLKEHLVNRGRRAEMLVVTASAEADDLPMKRIRVNGGEVAESMETSAGRPGPAPLVRAILSTLADRIVLVDAPPLVPVTEMETLLARLDEGCDVVVARPQDAGAGERRGLCFAAYRGAVARRVAALHGAQDFGCGDEHLFLLADPDLQVCEEPVRLRAGADVLPCSFSGALRQFRDARRAGNFGPLAPTPDVA